MEAHGAVNKYVVWTRKGQSPDTPPIYTINLTNGVTPFMLVVDRVEYSSACYKLTSVRPQFVLTIDQGWYRPTREEFDREPIIQDHVLNGGLLHAPLAEAINRQVPNDPAGRDWDYERFQVWCLEYYGKRRPPLADPTERKV